MKKYILSLIFLSFLVSFKTETEVEIKNKEKLIEFLGEKDYEYLKFKNSHLLKYYDYFIDNSYYIIEIPAEKKSDVSYDKVDLPLVNGKVDTEKLNVLLLDIERDYENQKRYLINGSSQVLVFYSEKEFIEKFNNANSVENEK